MDSTALLLGPQAAPPPDAAGLHQLAEQANFHHRECTASVTTAIDHARAAGDALILAKGMPARNLSRLGQGEFSGAPRRRGFT